MNMSAWQDTVLNYVFRVAEWREKKFSFSTLSEHVYYKDSKTIDMCAFNRLHVYHTLQTILLGGGGGQCS